MLSLGISRILARIEDGIFEGLPNERAKEFPLQFLNAINVGADLSMVFPKFMHWLLVDSAHGIIKFAKNKEAIQTVADLYQRKIDGENINLNEWLSVRETSAAYVAYADAADAAAAAYADAAYADATYAARQKARIIQADKLLELLSNAEI